MQKQSAEDGCGSPAQKELKSTEVLANERSQLLAKNFDKQVEATKDMVRRDKFSKWREFWKTEGEPLSEMFQGMKEQLERHEAPTTVSWTKHCDIQMPLRKAVYETLKDTEKYSDAQITYIDYVIQQADIPFLGSTYGVILIAFILYQRFKSTFEGGADISGAAIKKWFQDIRPAKFDDKQRPLTVQPRDEKGRFCKGQRVQKRDKWGELLFKKKMYQLSEREYSRLDALGACAVFAVCVQLGSFLLEDLSPAQFQFDETILTHSNRRDAILKEPDRKKRRAMADVDRHAFLIFELAVLDRIGWKTHVSVEQYMESVKTLPNLAEDKRQAILEMLEQHAGSSV